MRLIVKQTTVITTAIVISAPAIAVALVLLVTSSAHAQPRAQDTTGKMYWTEYDYAEVTGKIMRANQDGSQVQPLFQFYYGWVDGLATAGPLDVVGGKMYWSVSGTRGTSSSKVEIIRANLDGSQVESLVKWNRPASIEALWIVPTDLALDAIAGKIYWTAQGEYYKGKREQFEGLIQRANLDGSQVETLLSKLENIPTGIALDITKSKMYWSGSDRIQRANLDGSQVESVVSEPAGRLTLDVTEGQVYWSRSDKIKRANLDGSGVETLISGLDSATGIALGLDSGKIQQANLDGSGVETLVDWGTRIEPASHHFKDFGLLEGWPESPCPRPCCGRDILDQL